MTKEQKPFEYDEILAMCILCAGWATFITVEGKFKDEMEGRKMIEDKVREVVAIRWDAPDKKAIRIEL